MQKRELCVLFVALLLPSLGYASDWIVPAKTAAPVKRSKVAEQFRNDGRKLYKKLMVMSKDYNFQDSGFGWSENKFYRKWADDIQSLERNCYSELDIARKRNDESEYGLGDICIATNYLYQVGLTYATTRGTDDRYSKKLLVDVKKAFGK
jgi:hypothetical protein